MIALFTIVVIAHLRFLYDQIALCAELVVEGRVERDWAEDLFEVCVEELDIVETGEGGMVLEVTGLAVGVLIGYWSLIFKHNFVFVVT